MEMTYEPPAPPRPAPRITDYERYMRTTYPDISPRWWMDIEAKDPRARELAANGR